MNIPYIKSSPEEGGTHGIIGHAILRHCKPDAVIVNFARGELVDSIAMKEFLDASGEGKYISDFPDDLLWDHDNTIIVPHLGASTGEAEDTAAVSTTYFCFFHVLFYSVLYMLSCHFYYSRILSVFIPTNAPYIYIIYRPFKSLAAETLRLYLEDGTVRHSVNFPNASLPKRSSDNIRVTVVNENKPGVLSLITEVFAKHNLNIVQQINNSQGEIAYNVLDIEPADDTDLDFKELQQELTMHDGVLSSRVLFGLPGAGYSRNIDGQYHV